MAKKKMRLRRMLDRIAKAIYAVENEIACSEQLWRNTPHVNCFEREDKEALVLRRKRLIAFYRKKEKELDALTAMAA